MGVGKIWRGGGGEGEKEERKKGEMYGGREGEK